MNGRVFLVGAGPGDPGLLTARALELIAQADTILYDRLIPAEALEGARADAELLFVGKQGGGESMPQEQTEALMVERAQAGKIVVRLKGGDPFVFGRGGEEALTLRAEGIPFEVVPGITAGVAATAYAGIPVTHRGLASAVALITGHTGRTETVTPRLTGPRSRPSRDARLLHGRASATPHRRLADRRGTARRRAGGDRRTGHAAPPAHRHRHARHDRRAGASGGDPVALDYRGRRRRRARRPARLARAAAAERAHRGGHTRASPNQWARPAAARAGGRGGAGPGDPHPAAREWGRASNPPLDLSPYDLICLTSPNGVAHLFERLAQSDRHPTDARALAGARVAAIGPGTARALAEHGITADIVPERYVAESLVQALAELPVRRALVARAREARDVLPDALRARGAEVDVLELYETVAEPLSPPALAAARAADYITFTSSSTVRFFLEAAGGSAELSPTTRIVSIGPVTTATLREHGLEPARGGRAPRHRRPGGGAARGCRLTR